jgi:DNA-binding transcriptional LysR family regulator
MDRFDSMTAFVAVAQAGGFSAAARALGVPLATISRRVADLETELGVRLLHRSTRKVALSDAGQKFFASCRQLLDELKDAEEEVKGEYRVPTGELTITAPIGFGRLHLQPIALEFLAAYPQIALRLLLVDRVVNIVEEHVDVALRIADLADSSLIARPLGSIRMLVCASPAYLAQRGKPKHPRELTRHDGVVWSGAAAGSGWWFREGGVEKIFPVRARLFTTTPESALAAAIAGVGLVQITSYQAEAALRDGQLVRVLDKFECAATPVNVVYASNRLVPLKLRAFLDFAVPRLTARLQTIALSAAQRLR